MRRRPRAVVECQGLKEGARTGGECQGYGLGHMAGESARVTGGGAQGSERGQG